MAPFSPGSGRRDGMSAGMPASAVPAPGAVLFDRYRLDERLGQGGMAEVWRAHDQQLDRAVAIKLLHRHLLPDERSRERFAAEARAVAGLSHPGIVTLYDIVLDESQAAIVLELVDGEPLNDVIAREGRIGELAAAAITAQVAHALQAAHDHGLIHRDVKPANVLLSPDGRARLVDFGIARALDDRESGLTLPGTIMGTLRYMAPEQLAEGSADRSTDVFGLGSLLYEMLVGRPPFPAATPAALMAQQRQGAPPVLRVSPELAGLARTALQPDPERRPRSAALTAALLERWLEHRGVSSADLPAVTVAALHGGMLPRAAPGTGPRPAITPAPIVGRPAGPLAVAAAVAGGIPGAGSAGTAPPRRRRRANAAGSGQQQPALSGATGIGEPAGSLVHEVPRAGIAGRRTVEGGLASGTAPVVGGSLVGPGGGVARPAGPIGLTGPAGVVGPASAAGSGVEPVADPAAVTASRTAPRRLLGVGGRRVPLITAVGLAGLLVVGLLLAGALTGLQAGTSRPSPAGSATHLATAAPTPTPAASSAAPTISAAPAQAATAKPAPTKPGKGNPKPKDEPTDHRRRGN